jgi:hypothetical protein
VTRAPSTFRQADVTKAIKAAAAAGVDIARVEIDKSGRIVIVANKSTTGGQEAPVIGEANEWDRV